MSSVIWSVLGLDSSAVFYRDRVNLYHSGDENPFALVLMKGDHYVLRVGSGERFERGSNINLGRYRAGH